MKYGQEYKAALANEGFPSTWVASAISYRELKKCIKRLQKELLDLGLDAKTLQQVPNSFGLRRSSNTPETTSEVGAFVPELWIATDRSTGRFVDAGLTDETRDHFIQRAARLPYTSDSNGPTQTQTADVNDMLVEGDIEWTQIPLATATFFFDSLEPKLTELESLQSTEARRLEQLITELGTSIQQLTEPSITRSGKAKPPVDVETWRQIFALYIESTIFFSSHEQDHGSRTYIKAKSQLESFSKLLVKQGLINKLKQSGSKLAFDVFVRINLDILRVMRFQEINAVALKKILKKFDKHTALGAALVYPGVTASGPLARSIAKDMCAEVSSKVISVVPQQDDFICPICYSLAWRPIRLGCCNSIYCIRCIIQLQRECKDSCPMCRKPTVMLADQSRHIHSMSPMTKRLILCSAH